MGLIDFPMLAKELVLLLITVVLIRMSLMIERDCPRARLPTLKWFMAVAAVVVKNVVKHLEWSSRLHVYRVVS